MVAVLEDYPMTTTHHDESLHDRALMLAMRAMIALQPAMESGPEARPGFDELMAKTPAADDVTYAPAVVGGVAGWWCHPADARAGCAILYLHGGAYVIGSAAAYRHFVGQIAARAGMAAFVADYALAPERPFPAAFNDAHAVYRAMIEDEYASIVLAGDSAGGGLALALLAAVGGEGGPRAAIAMSPWIDLAFGGESIETRAKADPLLTRDRLAASASLYLGAHDPADPRVSALAAPIADLPPVQIHVGSDEILLDDSQRYADAVHRSGGDVDLHVWAGMVHVFPASVALLDAAKDALDRIGAFARAHC